MTFKELGISPEILKAIDELGFENAMPVQAETLPILLSQDVNLVALAQTGTGKTAAFGLPMIQKMDYSNKETEVLVLCPTRELCIQIANDCKNYAKYINGCTILPVYGGASIDIQIRALKKGVKMIVATPGRMNDLINRGRVDISKIKYVVLDEADEMLDMGFKDDLDNILSQAPEKRNTLLFSATMPKEVENIAKNYMSNPLRVQIGSRNQGSDNVSHYYYLVHAKDRYLTLKRIADYCPDIYAIVFCRTKIETQEVADMLIRDGYSADSLHGDLSQAQRDHVMNRFRHKNIQMLVATDVAARGLDVNDLTHVINYNLPDELDQYVHRSGRTGRADKLGISIAIINLKEKYKIKDIERQIKKEFTKAQIPTGKEVCTKQLFNMIDKVEQVDVNYSEIETFLPDIMKKLEWMDKEELIRKFVSLEFNRFLEYYRGAPDLNVDESRERNSRDRDDSGKGRRGDRGDRGDRDSSYKVGNYQRLFISMGHKDKVVPQRLIGMINDYTQDRDIEIGKIDILDNFSYIEIGADKAEVVIEAFKDKFVQGRPVTVEIAQPRNSTSRDRSSDRRSSDRRNDRRNDRRDDRNSSRNSSGRSSDRRTSDRPSSDRKRTSDRKRY
ncbi:MAG: DEAD/DEAH box helicase [Bacteroidales bacterium]|jgi:ATP-dependent RNA helicase DeaD|nr:DEAD/DEAH box helicase [Bacteroidales bacterium]MDD4528492.1 DEAD/DEAH box helicase [Bacteroidales bacterium]MDD4829977.1 DEAD/DEAH box helicase [Bacteroidales bacterium]